ncbi:glycogen debranching N-terminal domain-containing protein [Streptomyces sp. NPDC005840]|uniref:glycogen debranching N-terminal domain-containing protein n=1 Tax=Streptomyces sp. NPDC005840 TaxID=3157072 RepID=UPI003408F2F4
MHQPTPAAADDSGTDGSSASSGRVSGWDPTWPAAPGGDDPAAPGPNRTPTPPAQRAPTPPPLPPLPPLPPSAERREPPGTVPRSATTPPATATRPPRPATPADPFPPPRRSLGLPAAHTALICVALPTLAISTDQGQLNGQGLEGFYRSGRRVLSRCQVRVAGREPVAVQARMTASDRARFVGTLSASPLGGPDPDVTVERVRSADGTERITLRSSAPRPFRVPVEVALGTDLAELAAIAAGTSGPELPAGVHESGLRWSGAAGTVTVTADPPPSDMLASAGLLRWEFELLPGVSRTLELRTRSEGGRALRTVTRSTNSPFAQAHASGDEPGIQPLLRSSVEDLQALLLRDPAHPADVLLAAGAPWRCGPAPAEALAAARMALPLGTGLAAGTLRALARVQLGGPAGRSGMIPGPRRDAGTRLPPECTGTLATLLFPALLAEAYRWGLPERDTTELLPAAERCLSWLLTTVGDRTYLSDPQPGGPVRCATQAHAHRAAVLGAELLETCGRPGAAELRQWARELRRAFQSEFWIGDLGGGRPAAARMPDGTLAPHLAGTAAHLLDTGLLGGGRWAPGLLDRVQTEQLARLLGGPSLDSGWGLRGLGAQEPGHNPFGHRDGAVRVHETAVAIAGLAAAGYEKEASSLLRGTLAASAAFGHRLPEMYAGERRTEGSAPLPHPAACRPAATAASAGVLLATTLAGIRPDAPAGTVTLRPWHTAPLGEIVLTGLRVAGAPFSVRVSRLGLAMVEEAAEGLRLAT